MNHDCEIVIVGGGMVGATLACALAHEGFSVAVVDAEAPPAVPFPGEYDLRVSAITLAAQRVFGNLGVWEAMAAQRISPFREMRVWDKGGRASVHFDSAEIGESALGHIIENRVVRHGLWQCMDQLPGVEVFCPASVESFSIEPDGVSVSVSGGRTLRSLLLVGADGSDSAVRARAGIAVRGWPYDQKAVVATVKPERDHGETAWQRFLPTGPVAFLPLVDGSCSIVWSMESEQADGLLALEEAEFNARLGKAFEYALGQIQWSGPRSAFPLRLQHATQYVQPRLALVGDAAHTIHPLAGQGVNLGLLDAAVLAQVLSEGRAAGRDAGSAVVLRRYERWRKGDNLAMLAAMDGFKRLFGTRFAPLRWLRNAGMAAFDVSGPLKRQVMGRAAGLSGELPRLAR